METVCFLYRPCRGVIFKTNGATQFSSHLTESEFNVSLRREDEVGVEWPPGSELSVDFCTGGCEDRT
jgi:hypothetical protein